MRKRRLSFLERKERHAHAVKRWEQNYPMRVKQIKREAMLWKVARTHKLPCVKTLLKHGLSANQISAADDAKFPRHFLNSSTSQGKGTQRRCQAMATEEPGARRATTSARRYCAKPTGAFAAISALRDPSLTSESPAEFEQLTEVFEKLYAEV
ncbi:MAG: hypothetical protein SGPRY_003527 [Prymnesium sp.]